MIRNGSGKIFLYCKKQQSDLTNHHYKTDVKKSEIFPPHSITALPFNQGCLNEHPFKHHWVLKPNQTTLTETTKTNCPNRQTTFAIKRLRRSNNDGGKEITRQHMGKKHEHLQATKRRTGLFIHRGLIEESLRQKK